MQRVNNIKIVNGNWGVSSSALSVKLGQQRAEDFLRDNQPASEKLIAGTLDWESAINLLMQELSWPTASQFLIENLISSREIKCPSQCTDCTLSPAFDGSFTLGVEGRIPNPMNLSCSSCGAIIHINQGFLIASAEHQPHIPMD